MKLFEMENPALRNQFDYISWIEQSGVSEQELNESYKRLMEQDGKVSRTLIKAKLFALLCEKSRLAIDKEDIFQDKLWSGNFLNEQRDLWYTQVTDEFMPELTQEILEAF